MGRCRGAPSYASLSDQHLIERVRSIRKRLMRARMGYELLERKYQRELLAAGREIRARLMRQDDRPRRAAASLRWRIEFLAAAQGVPYEKLQVLVRRVSDGRAQTLRELTELQALVLWITLGGRHVDG